MYGDESFESFFFYFIMPSLRIYIVLILKLTSIIKIINNLTLLIRLDINMIIIIIKILISLNKKNHLPKKID